MAASITYAVFNDNQTKKSGRSGINITAFLLGLAAYVTAVCFLIQNADLSDGEECGLLLGGAFSGGVMGYVAKPLLTAKAISSRLSDPAAFHFCFGSGLAGLTMLIAYGAMNDSLEMSIGCSVILAFGIILGGCNWFSEEKNSPNKKTLSN